MTRIVFHNARIFDGEAEPYAGACVVEGERIAWVGREDPPPQPGDEVYDLAGQTLMPGLISCHLHPDNLKFGLPNFLAGEWLGKERPPGVLMAIGVRTCRVLLESGFTGYVGAACSNYIDAQLKMAIEEEIVPGPRIRPCGHHLGTTADNNDSPKWWQDVRTPGTDLFADGPDAMRRLVREEIRCGAEIVKVFASSGHAVPNRRGRRNIARDELAALVDTAHERGVKVRAHCSDREMIHECLELGVDVIDHGDEIDEAAIDMMAKRGAFWIPSLLYTRLTLDRGSDPGGGASRSWENVLRMIPIAHKAGVRMAIGDDYGGGSMRHEIGVYASELTLYATRTGLSPRDILRWGTANAGALLCDTPGEAGVVRDGAYADLIVVDGDPTVDIAILEQPKRRLRAVMRNGRFFSNALPAPHQGGVDQM